MKLRQYVHRKIVKNLNDDEDSDAKHVVNKNWMNRFIDVVVSPSLFWSILREKEERFRRDLISSLILKCSTELFSKRNVLRCNRSLLCLVIKINVHASSYLRPKSLYESLNELK